MAKAKPKVALAWIGPRYTVAACYRARPDADIDRWFERRARRRSDGTGFLIPTGERDIAWDYTQLPPAKRLWVRLRAEIAVPNKVVRQRAPRARVDLFDHATGLFWTANKRWERRKRR